MGFGIWGQTYFDAEIAIGEVISSHGEDRGREEAVRFVALQNLPPSCYCEVMCGTRQNLDPVAIEKETSAEVINDFKDIVTHPESYRLAPFYGAALKLSTLRLRCRDDNDCFEAFKEFIRWSYDSYLIVAAAWAYGSLAFSPRRHANMFKNLREKSSEQALAGVRNIAWDMKLLSYWGKLAGEDLHQNRMTVLATFDAALQNCAEVFVYPHRTESQKLEMTRKRSVELWGEHKGTRIFREYVRCYLGSNTDGQRAAMQHRRQGSYWKSVNETLEAEFIQEHQKRVS
jgi:hypothetical protein